jgi:hypothetical protein
MRFVEINLFGVYVAPLSVLLVAAWLVTVALRRLASRLGWMDRVWHPSLFMLAVYVIVLASMTLIAAH